MNKHFVNYHCHNSYSNISTPDCASTVLDYINRAKELNHKMLFCTQHGGTQGWTELYQECKKNNIKFGVGAEVYWVKDRFEKDKTNNHLIILAKNENGRRALNRIISEASKTGYYYKTRVDIDLIMSLPENDVVLTTACLGFYGYENYEEYIKMFHDKFKNNFFLEVQANNVDKQINLNKELLELSKKYNIKLIAGLDSHFIYPEEKEDRRLFLLSKGIEYELEHGWDMDYCDYDTLFNRFKNQNIFSDEQIIDFIEITNLFLDFEDIYLDFENIKLPTIYKDKTQEEKNYILKRILADEVKNKFGTIDIPIEYKKAINEEWKVIEDTNMADYFLLNYEIIKRGIELGGRITLTSRGSAPSWIICNLLGFTTIDRVHSPIQLYPERFLTTDRILAGSVPDIDYNLGNREAFIQAQKDILGDDNSYFFASYGKLKEKSAWKMFAKANNIPYEISNEITKYIDDYEKAKKYADEEESIEIEKYIPKEYLEVFNGSKKYQGIIDSISCAPCGFLLSQDSISENIGLIRTREGICCNIDGLTADKALMLKNDLLSVTVVDIIYDTFEKIGINPITSTELINVTKGDSKVWDIYKNGYTMCLNQVEQPKTREKVMKYKPLNISELSAFVASVRPAFQSMLNTFLNREDFRYGIDALDDILMTEELPQSLLLYQENLMSVLSYSGFPITETYSIMKSIAKKKTGIIEPIKDRFLDGFTKNSKADMSKTMMVWKIIEDSASYLFNASHSLSVALDSLYGAYLKAYYPLEFYTTVIEIYTEKKDLDKLTLIKSEMKEFGIKEQKAKFRNDSKISFNKENNTINASISSIKHISESCANGLYSLKDKQYSNFYELVKDIYDNKIANSRQLNILIMLNYFEEFGKIGKLLKIEELYQAYNGKKTFKKENLNPDVYDIIKKYSEKETAKQFSNVNIDMVINEIISTIKDFDIPTKDKILAEFQYVGYATTTDNCGENICIVSNIDDSKSNPILTLYYLATGVSKNIKIKSKVFKDSGLRLYNLMKVIEISLDRKWIMDGKDVNGKNKYKRGDEKEEILTLFEILA